MKAIFLIAIAVVVINAKVPWPFETCGTPAEVSNYTVELTNGYLTEAPRKSSTNEMTLVGTALEHLEFEEVTLTAYLNGIPVQVYHNKYAAVFDEGDPITYVYPNEIPGFTPSGKYLVTFQFKTKAKKQVGCAGFRFTL